MNLSSSPPPARPRRASLGESAAGFAVAMLVLAGAGTACGAAESIAQLGSAFRPQTAPAEGPAPRREERRDEAESDVSGVRVVVVPRGPAPALASIDGRLVKVGDTVDGAKVSRITADEVVLRKDDGTLQRLPVNPAAVKRMRPEGMARDGKGAVR